MFRVKIHLLLLTVALLSKTTSNTSLSNLEEKKSHQAPEGQGLYTPDDDVVILTVHNFKSTVMNSPQAWLVEFYNSWCGFCQRFAPSWKALATDVKGWRDMIQIAALDCSVDENTPLCREYEIMAYPSLRYFHENYVAAPQNLGKTVQKGEDVNSHRRNLCKQIVNEQGESRGGQYPNVLPYTHPNLEHLFDGVPDLVQYAFLIIEKPDTCLGVDVALDLHKTREIVVRYTSANNSGLINMLGVNVIPAVIAVDRRNNYYILSGASSRTGTRKLLTEFLTNKRVRFTDETPKQKIFTGRWLDVQVPDMSAMIQERARQALRERVKRMGDVVFQVDLETALRYSLTHEIATIKTIDGVKLTVLRDYLTVLRKYFPLGPVGKLFLAELAMKASASEVSGTELAEIVRQAELEGSHVFSSPQQWLGCRGSTAAHRGYPCGLWKMFHFLTVNSAEQNLNDRYADPLEVLNVMFGYVKYFFGCHDCSQHFQEMTIRRAMRNVSSLDSSILWLWMAHNEVNNRLAGDQTEDPEFPKIQFPSKINCPQCRFANNTWNLNEVLRYLKHMYSSINVRYIGADTRVLHAGLNLDGNQASNRSSSIFRPFDMSMCFMLYVCSFLLLALLIRMFLKRGYRKKPYSYDILGKV